MQQKLPHVRFLFAGITGNHTRGRGKMILRRIIISRESAPRGPLHPQSWSRRRSGCAATDYTSRFKGLLALSKFCRRYCLRWVAQFFCTRHQLSRLMTISKKIGHGLFPVYSGQSLIFSSGRDANLAETLFFQMRPLFFLSLSLSLSISLSLSLSLSSRVFFS